MPAHDMRRYTPLKTTMPHSLSHGKSLDVGHIGIQQAQLPPLEQGPIDLRSWFGADRQSLPLELEIGSGKGTFLVQQAQQTPDVNYIGIEYARAFWRHAADRIRRHHLNNVRMLHTEAGSFLQHYVPAGCLRQIHVYFPDPWPKKRHHKRRLIQAPTLTLMHAALQADGLIRLVTDHQDYFDWMQQHAAQVSHLFNAQPFDRPASADQGELVGTNFERKYRREGRPFYAMVLHRRQA